MHGYRFANGMNSGDEQPPPWVNPKGKRRRRKSSTDLSFIDVT